MPENPLPSSPERARDALKASKGAVVLISGSAAFDPKPGFAAVATINAAIIALAKAFAEQGIEDGVQVNSVVPGAVMTCRRRSFIDHGAGARNERGSGHEAVFPSRPTSLATVNRRRLRA